MNKWLYLISFLHSERVRHAPGGYMVITGLLGYFTLFWVLEIEPRALHLKLPLNKTVCFFLLSFFFLKQDLTL